MAHGRSSITLMKGIDEGPLPLHHFLEKSDAMEEWPSKPPRSLMQLMIHCNPSRPEMRTDCRRP